MSTRTMRLVGVASLVASAFFVRTARADSPVYADINGMCGGLTPCFSTIQQAVINATDPDGGGPLFAEVYVFPGVYSEGVHIEVVPGDLQMTTVDGVGAPKPRTAAIDPANGPAIYNAVFEFPGRIVIDGFVVTSPNAAAIDLLGTADIVVANVLAHDAGYSVVQDPFNLVGTGIKVVSSLGDVVVRDSTARDCGALGVVAASAFADVTMDSVEASDNGAYGVHLESTEGVIARNSRALKNNLRGMIVTGNTVLIEQCRFENNLSDGLYAIGGDELFVLSSTAIGNMGNGFDVAGEPGSVTLDGLTAEGNGGDGVSVAMAREAMVSNSSSTRSGQKGFNVYAEGSITIDGLFSRQNRSGVVLTTLSDVSITNAAVEGSKDFGFLIGSSGSVTLDRITAKDGIDEAGVIVEPNGATDFVRSLTIRNSLIANHDENPGVRLIKLAPNGSHVIVGSIICGNNGDGPGLLQETTSTATIDARGNWWGDVTGPKRPNKPGGLGDGVEPGGGEILVDPWIDQITAVSSKSAATLADDVVVQFQFRHSGSDRFLGEGPGAIGASRPFTVVTDNGTVGSHDGTAPAVSAFITKDKGIVEVVAKGSNEGPAKVELSGLCFPTRSVTIQLSPAPAPQPEPEPEPSNLTPSPNASSSPPPAARRGAPACGAGVPVMAGLSAIGLLATRLSPGSRRRVCQA